MKITQILYSGLGGHGNVAYSLIEADAASRARHSLIFYGVESVKEEYIIKNRELNLEFSDVIKRKGLDLKSYFKIYSKLKLHAPDALILHSITLIPIVYLFCLFNKCKLIAVEHNDNTIKRKSEWLWTLISLWLASKVIYLTETYREQIRKKLGILYRHSATIIIPNGLNLNKYIPGRIPGLSSSPTMLFMQSRFTLFRDHDTLIEAVEQVALRYNIHLMIAGDGETKNVIQKKIREKSLQQKITLLGTLSEAEIIEKLHQTDIYIHSSLAETMSTAIMQAMACGLAVIATDIPGINNLVQNNVSGILFNPKDACDLAKKITILLQDENLRKKLSENALRYANRNLSNILMFENYLLLCRK